MQAGCNRAVSGYAGGFADNPSIASQTANTGHAGSRAGHVRPERFRPATTSPRSFFTFARSDHVEPTGGNDVGPQYRSAIYYHTPEQGQIAEELIKELGQEIWQNPIVTEVGRSSSTRPRTTTSILPRQTPDSPTAGRHRAEVEQAASATPNDLSKRPKPRTKLSRWAAGGSHRPAAMAEAVLHFSSSAIVALCSGMKKIGS